MLATDEDAVVCDMAETYRIYDMYALPASAVARLACGLREDSRIKSKMAGYEVSMNTFLLTAILDDLRMLLWLKTEDGQKGRNRPKPLTAKLLTHEPGRDENLMTYSTASEYEEARRRIIERAMNGGD